MDIAIAMSAASGVDLPGELHHEAASSPIDHMHHGQRQQQHASVVVVSQGT